MLKLIAIVEVSISIKRELEFTGDNLPLSIGAITLKSKDGLREYILDSQSTNYNNPQTKNSLLTLDTRCEIDLHNFPLEKGNYSITVEDLADCTGLFYCSDVDCEDGEDCFDYENVKALAIITDIDTEKQYTIPVTLEV